MCENPIKQGRSVETLYDNLATNFNHVITHVLGKDYYNMGMDVYTSHILSSQDLMKAYDDLKHERDDIKRWNDGLKSILWLMSFGFFLLLYLTLGVIIK